MSGNQPAVLVDDLVVRFGELEAVGGDPFLERRDLTVDRVIARLPLARHARIERDRTALAHGSPLRRFAVFDLIRVRPTLPGVATSRVRRTSGTRLAYASMRCSALNLVGSNDTHTIRRGRSVRRTMCASIVGPVGGLAKAHQILR